MKLDKFTWIVIAVVAALLIAAVVSVSRTGAPTQDAAFLTEDGPATPVYNIFLALQQGNPAKARQYYSESALADIDKQGGYGPLESYRPNGAQRLRIISVSTDEAEPDRAYVTFVIDNYNNTGPFGAGSTYSYERTVEVIREGDGWKVDSTEYFY
jgi:hypothetical protein